MRHALITLVAVALVALPIPSLALTSKNEALTSIDYMIATRNEAVSVSSAVFATYIGSCLNKDARSPSLDEHKRNAVYVCYVRPKIVSEMLYLKFVPDTIGYRRDTIAR
jgi:hypothetical protein